MNTIRYITEILRINLLILYYKAKMLYIDLRYYYRITRIKIASWARIKLLQLIALVFRHDLYIFIKVTKRLGYKPNQKIGRATRWCEKEN